MMGFLFVGKKLAINPFLSAVHRKIWFCGSWLERNYRKCNTYISVDVIDCMFMFACLWTVALNV